MPSWCVVVFMLGLASTVLVAATCSAPLPDGPPVPAPIVFKTGCGGFRLGPDGQVIRLRGWIADRLGANPERRFGAGFRVQRDRAGRIELLRADRLAWRSRDLYPNTAGDVAFGPNAFAFSSYNRGVFLTDLRSAERLVVPGRALYPHGFFDSGCLIVSGSGTISVLSPSGRVERRYDYDRRGGYTFDSRSNTMYFVTPRKRVASLREPRLQVGRRVHSDGWIWLGTPERLLFSGSSSLTLTDLSGRLLAQARWSRSPHVVMDSGAVVSEDGRRVAFRLSDTKRKRSVVYVLRSGRLRAEPVFRHRLDYVGCGAAAVMMWQRHRLLYRAADGHIAVIDAGTGSVRDLTRLVRALPRRVATDQPLALWA